MAKGREEEVMDIYGIKHSNVANLVGIVGQRWTAAKWEGHGEH
jgi:hypothetical protein